MPPLGALLTLLGCAARTEPSAAPLAASYANWPDPFETMARGPGQTAAVCARANDHVVRDVPYHNVKVTDPGKLANMTRAYQRFQRGEGALPDIRDVFPDDPAALAHMGLSTEPGLDGRGALLQSCSQCHNLVLDQTLTRARFRADLVGVDRATKDAAIMRLSLPPEGPRAMPPARLRVLSDEARQLAIAALRQ